MDRRTANRSRRARHIHSQQKSDDSKNDPPPRNINSNAQSSASSRNIIASNFKGNQNSKKMLLAQLGLDDPGSYIELKTGDYFIEDIDNLSYCALCSQKFSKFNGNQRNDQSSRISTSDAGSRNARFPRLSSTDKNQRISRFLKHNDEKHLEAFAQLLSELKLTTPGLETMNMLALQHLTTKWLDDNFLTEDQVNTRLTAIEDFDAILNMVDPQCQCRIIGSFATGAILSDSDINLELMHPNNKLFESDPRAKNSIHHKLVDPAAEYGNQINNHTMHYDLIANAADTLHRVAKCIEMNYLPVHSFKLVRRDYCSELSSKIPRLLLWHEPSRITLEILCHADTRYQMDRLIKNYISLDSRVPQLGVLVKRWAKICRISNPNDGTFSPQTWMILVIHYLQKTMPPVLPCLHDELVKNDDKSCKQGGGTSDTIDNELDKNEEEPPRRRGTRIESIDNTDDADDEIEDEPEGETISHDFDQNMIDSLDWTSQNTDPIHKLFVNFLKFSINEFKNHSTVISILTNREVTINSKGWKAQFKSIENPMKPRNNLAKSISSVRTFEYIKQCFNYGYFYLTSIPTTINLRPRPKPLSYPDNYVELFFNYRRFSSYLDMIRERFDSGTKTNLIGEMIQQNLFARDVRVVDRLVEYCVENNRSFDSIAQTVSRHYDQNFLIPPDIASTSYCWLCRRSGHTKPNCPKRRRRIKQGPQYLDAVEFDAEFIELYENDAISAEQSERHLAIVRELEHSFCLDTGLECALQLYGSSVNSLGSIDSDLDICMTLRDKPNGRDVNCIAVLKKIFVALSKNEHVSDIEPILAARVPIIKFKYDDHAVDLSMYNECAIHNSRLLRTYVSIDMRVAQLCYLVKRYARSCGIADASRGSLSSYAWNLLVIHFLQHTNPPILPVLQATYGKKPVFGVNGWNVWFEQNIEVNTLMPNDSSLTSLLKQFLLYYSKFDFDQYVISIRTTRLLTKFQKNWTNCMIAIEDPFELTYNLAGSLQDQMALYILQSFPKTHGFISDFQEKVCQLPERPTAEALRSLFNGRDIMGEDPPNRGCRRCGKIGHRVKDCPGKIFGKLTGRI